MFTESEKAYLLELLQHDKKQIKEDMQGHAATCDNDLEIVNSIINKVEGVL